MATLLLDRNEPLMAMDILRFMVVDTDKTRGKLQQVLKNGGILLPSLAGVVHLAHIEMLFSKLTKLPLDLLSSTRLVITALKDHRDDQSRGHNSKTINVEIKAGEALEVSSERHKVACFELEGLVKAALFGR